MELSGPPLASQHAAVGRALVELVREKDVRRGDLSLLLRDVDGAALVAAAERNRLMGTLYRSLAALDADTRGHLAGTLHELRAPYQMARASALAKLADLAIAAPALDNAGIPWIVFKGPVLAEHHYGDPGARSYVDLDMGAPPRYFRATVDALEAVGGQVAPWDWSIARKARVGEVPLTLPYGTPADLHWHLAALRRVRARHAISLEAWIARRRRVRVGGLEVPTLDPVDTVLHLCFHASVSGGHLLVWLKDLECVVRVEDIDWDELVRRAHVARLGLVVAVQLQRARVVLGAAVPASVLSALVGHRVRAQWAIPASWKSDAVWAGGSRTGMTLTRSTAGTRSGTGRALVQLLAEEVVPSALRLAAGRITGADRPSLEDRLYTVGPRDDPGRELYMRAVEEAAW